MADQRRETGAVPRMRSWPNALSRRQLFKTVGGLGLALSSGVWVPSKAEADSGQESCISPLPIPHTTSPPFTPAEVHFFFPGPVTGVAFPPVDPTGAHPNGRDPSTITHFKGVIGQVDLNFSGTGTDTTTGATGTFNFHTDTRFMKGVFIGEDEERHQGTFAFI
jgi:hypothetical protein